MKAFHIYITFHALGDFCPVVDLGFIQLYRSRVQMKALFQNFRALTGLVLLIFALFLSFDGFPGAMVSWLGGGVVMSGYTGSIATITHEDTGEGKLTAGMRILVISVGFAIASFGSAMIDWGGLTSVTLSDTFTVPFRETGILFGIAGGLYNVDRQLLASATAKVKND
jgi:hypothetical protein